MPWGVLKDQTIPALKDASLEERKAFAKVANAALNEGKSEKDAIIAGLSSAKNAKAIHKAKLPQHLQAILDIVDSARNAPEIEPQDTPQNAPERSVSSSNWFSSTIHTLDDSNAAESVLKASEGTARNLIGANFDTKGALILKFSNGDTIRTNEQVLKEYIEQYVTVATTPFFDWIKFNTTANYVVNEGEMAWNDVDGTVDIGLKGGNVTLQVGQEQIVRFVNHTAVDMTEMQVVRIVGAQGNRLSAVLAQSNTEANSNTTFAVVTEPIPHNQQGYATVNGLVRDINTSAFAEGAVLYLSPTVAGGITDIIPTSPNRNVRVGYCVRSHAALGSIFVNIINDPELSELPDVGISLPQEGDILTYTNGLWRNTSASALNAQLSAAPAPVSYFVKVNTVANVPTVINHNLNLTDKDAFCINTTLASTQVFTNVQTISVNSLSIATSVNSTNLSVMITGLGA